MGGSSSGRYRVRNRGTVESAIRLDIRVMRRRGFLTPGTITTGAQRWTWAATGEQSGSVGVTVNLSDPTSGFMVIRFNLNGEPRVQEIGLASTPMRLGGRRYYFVCPRLGLRCEVLPMVGGLFASRQAHRLTYQSQSSDQLDRLRDRADKLEKRLWPAAGLPKPRGKRRERLLEAWSRDSEAFEDLLAATILRRWGALL